MMVTRSGSLIVQVVLLLAGLLVNSSAQAANASASCRIDASPVLEKGDSFGINITLQNHREYRVVFTVTTKKSLFFGSDDTVAVREVGAHLGVMQFLTVGTANVQQTGKGPIVVEVTSNATGSTVLARCSTDLTVYSPDEVTVPPVSEPVLLDGVCNATEYAAAGVVGIRLPQYTGPVAFALHTPSDLYVCLSGLKTAAAGLQGDNRATVQLNRAGIGDALPGPDDLAFEIAPDGRVQGRRGGSGGFTGPDPGGYEAKVATQAAAKTWSSELRISRAALGDGGWDRTIGFTVLETAVDSAGDAFAWPTSAQVLKPSSWGQAHLIETAAPGVADLRVSAIEVTQSIQSLNNEVLLIAGKRTFVRVHVETHVVADIANDQGARLHGLRADGSPLGEPLLPINANRVFLDPTADRGAIDASYLFELPAEWVKAGSIELKAEVNPLHVVGESRYDNNTMSTGLLAFLDTHAVTIVLIPYTYKYDGQKKNVPDEWMDRTELMLRWELPADLVVKRHPEIYNAAKDGYSMFVAQEYVRDLLVEEGSYRPEVYYYAVMSAGGGVARGGIANVAAGNLGQTAVHEVGHMFGLDHVLGSPDCNKPDGPFEPYPYPQGIIGGPEGNTARFYGFDPADGYASTQTAARVVPPGHHDNLTYCSSTWQSDYSYRKIWNVIQAAGAGGGKGAGMTPLPPQVTVPGLQSVLVVRAVASPSLEILGLRLKTVRMDRSFRWVQPQGRYQLKLLDARDRLLAQYPLRADTWSDAQGHLALSASVPLPPLARRLTIGVTGSNRVLASQSLSAAPPAVTVQALSGGPSFAANAVIPLRWAGTASDGDRLHYDVLYSSDSGATWKALATDLPDAHFDIDAALLGGTRTALAGRLRVVVSDGVNTGRGDSAPFSLAGKPPLMALAAPTAGLARSYGQPVTLLARVSDLQDDKLPETQIVWSSSRDGRLGTGRRLTPTRLSPGAHVISVQATNSLGLSSSRSVALDIAAHSNADQRNEGPWTGGGINILPTNTMRQSFVPFDACLTGVDVALSTGNRGQGGGTVWLSVKDEMLREIGRTSLVLAEGFEGFAHFDTSSRGGLLLTPGRRYVLEVAGPQNNAFFWRYVSGNPYGRGQAFSSGAIFGNNDFLFRTYGGKSACKPPMPSPVVR